MRRTIIPSGDVRYRPDIDGMRALAVISVISFHLSRSWLPGGYFGVDIFFVLSGYLITGIIWREIHEQTFSITRFYDRRLRRIMPALLLVLCLTTVASVIFLLPADLVGFGKSALATLSFSANVYFWRDTDYFSSAAEQKPLLHLWSLGVEEQFYILFPAVLATVARWWPRRALVLVAGLTLVSLAVNVAVIRIGGGSPAFFLLPSRAWELGVGAMISLLPVGVGLQGAMARVCASAGLGMIVLALLHPIDGNGYMPVALPAVLGTALLILSGQCEAPLPNRLLQSRVPVFVGLISYSLYLWHWPVIVFTQYYLARQLSAWELAAVLAVTAVGAILSWRFVEIPFRDMTMAIRKVRLVAGAAAITVASSAAMLVSFQGFPGRLNAEAATLNQAVDTNYRCPLSDFLALGASRACTLNLPSRRIIDANVVLLGNSHAQMYAPLWADIFRDRGLSGLLVPANGCLPTVLANIDGACIRVAETNLKELSKLKDVRLVVIGLTWQHGRRGLVDPSGNVLDNSDDGALIAAVDDLIARLRGYGMLVVLIGPIAEPGWQVASIRSRQLAFGRVPDRPTFEAEADFNRLHAAVFQHYEAMPGVGFARPDTVQCRAGRCDYVRDGRSLFSDSNHIAVAELPRFRQVFEAALRAAVTQSKPWVDIK